MGKKRNMTPKQKAEARRDVVEQASDENLPDEEKPMNGDHFVISIALIIVVAIAATVFSFMQGGVI